jgi:hypothetical protein
MSRPQKIIPPIKGTFNGILTSIALGSGKGKKAAVKLAKKADEPNIIKASEPKPPKQRPKS